MFTIMFTLILAEWQARAVESLITYNCTCTWTYSLTTDVDYTPIHMDYVNGGAHFESCAHL